jgi:LiaF transmembrane domain
MSEQQRNEKQEKEEEKHRQEQEKQEKNYEEKWRRDPLSAMVWAGILIWAGVVLLADNVGFLARFERLEAWALVFIGAGLIIFLEVAIRLLVPAYRRPVGGSIIFGVVLMAIGLGDLISWNIIWPLVLIAIGLYVLLRGFGWRR